MILKYIQANRESKPGKFVALEYILGKNNVVKQWLGFLMVLCTLA